MDMKFVTAKYKKDIKISKKIIDYINQNFTNKNIKIKNIAIYSSIQFLSQLEKVKKFLEDNNFFVISSTPNRAMFEGQVLGCDSYHDSLNLNLEIVDLFLYIGDGMFHPSALVLVQENSKKIKPIMVLNPFDGDIKLIEINWMERYLKKRKGNLLKFYTSNIIGVYISSKWGQEYKKISMQIEKKYPEKQFYFFISNDFDYKEIDNFNFIECFVNTACPRIAQDDILNHKISIVNIKDVL